MATVLPAIVFAALANVAAALALAGKGHLEQAVNDWIEEKAAPSMKHRGWIGEAALRSSFDNATIDTMLANGAIEARENPDMPSRTQFLVKDGTVLNVTRHAYVEPLVGENTERISEAASLDNEKRAWMSDSALLEEHPNIPINTMVAKGLIAVRKNPDNPTRRQFHIKDEAALKGREDSKWISEADMYQRYDHATVDMLLAKGLAEVRRNPDIPNRRQFLVKPALGIDGDSEEAQLVDPPTPVSPRALTEDDHKAASLDNEKRGWISESKLHDEHPNTSISSMLAKGLIEVRKNPDNLTRRQFYVKDEAALTGREDHKWISEADMYQRYDHATVDMLLAKSLAEVRRNPDIPNRKQFLVKPDLGIDGDGEEAQLVDPPTPVSPRALTEDDYKAVVMMQDDDAMKGFVLQVIEDMNRKALNENDLNGFVPWFSGKRGVQSFEAMQRQLAAAPWVGPKNDLPSDAGPQHTASEDLTPAEATDADSFDKDDASNAQSLRGTSSSA